jgi:hypothetical protein
LEHTRRRPAYVAFASKQRYFEDFFKAKDKRRKTKARARAKAKAKAKAKSP